MHLHIPACDAWSQPDMTKFPFHIVGFDLDGTLFDTSADLSAAVNATLKTVGVEPLDFAALRQFIGGGGRQMLAQSLATQNSVNEAELDRLYARFLVEYQAHIADQTKPYPGLSEALDQLVARGVKLAVVTNKREDLTLALLDALGWRERFTAIIGAGSLGSDSALLKPNSAPIYAMIERSGGIVGKTRTAFVGDSHFDVDAAHNAGIPCVAVPFGFSDRPVEELGADAIIQHYDELIGALEELGQT